MNTGSPLPAGHSGANDGPLGMGVLRKIKRSADSHVRVLRPPWKTSPTLPNRITRTQRSALQALGQYDRVARPALPAEVLHFTRVHLCASVVQSGLSG